MSNFTGCHYVQLEQEGTNRLQINNFNKNNVCSRENESIECKHKQTPASFPRAFTGVCCARVVQCCRAEFARVLGVPQC